MKRIGIIGATGNQGAMFVKWFERIPDAAVVRALCDTRRAKLEPIAAETGASVWLDYRRMLAEADIDVCIVATPDRLHAPVVLAAAEAGKAVLCEKPLAMTVDEASCLRDAVRARGVGDAINLQHRYVPAMQALKARMDDGELGELIALHGRIAVPLPDAMPMTWRQERGGSAGGALADCGSHLFDFANWLLGALPESVLAFAGIAVPRRPVPERAMDLVEAWTWAAQQPAAAPVRTDGAVETSDHAEVLLRYPGNRLATVRVLEAETLARVGPYIVVEAHGRRASAVCRIDWGLPGLGDLTIHRGAGKEPETIAFPATDRDTWMAGVLRDALAALDARAAGKTHPFPGFEDGVNLQRVIAAGLRSAAEGAWIAP